MGMIPVWPTTVSLHSCGQFVSGGDLCLTLVCQHASSSIYLDLVVLPTRPSSPFIGGVFSVLAFVSIGRFNIEFF